MNKVDPYPETWYTITDYPEYKVSTLGEVKSYVRPKKPIILNQHPNTHGYLTVNLRFEGKTKTIAIHILVAKYILELEIEGMQVNHKDLDKTNNITSNLELTTSNENQGHAKNFLTKKPTGCFYVKNRKTKPWRAKIEHNKKRIHLGYFETMEEAREAYVAKYIEIYNTKPKY